MQGYTFSALTQLSVDIGVSKIIGADRLKAVFLCAAFSTSLCRAGQAVAILAGFYDPVRQPVQSGTRSKSWCRLITYSRDNAMTTKASTGQTNSAQKSEQKSENTTSRDPHTRSPRLFIDAGNKRFLFTDEHLALFSENHHKESLEVLLTVIEHWGYRAIDETKGNSPFHELTAALIRDLSDYVIQSCSVLATYPSMKQVDNVEKVSGGAA